MLKILFIFIMIVTCLPYYASANDFKSYIREAYTRNVTDPCYREAVRRVPTRLTNIIGPDKMFEVYKMWWENVNEGAINLIIDDLLGSPDNMEAYNKHRVEFDRILKEAMFDPARQQCIDFLVTNPKLVSGPPHNPLP